MSRLAWPVLWFASVALGVSALATANTNAAANDVSHTQTPALPEGAQARIARLAQLARIWGDVKYLHPALGQRALDWDTPLIAALPKVDAARTQQDLVAAINCMLAALDDPGTSVQAVAANRDGRSVGHLQPVPADLAKQVFWIDALATASSATEPEREPTRMAQAASKSGQPIVLDLRAPHSLGDDQAWAMYRWMRDFLPQLLDRDLALAAKRFRQHSGFVPQTGGSSGGYFSAIATSAPELLVGQAKTAPPRIIVLVNRHSFLLDIVSGLQGAGLAFVIQEGEASHEDNSTTLALDDQLELVLTTSELMNPDGSVGFTADRVVAAGDAMKVLQEMLGVREWQSARRGRAAPATAALALKDAAYADMLFPTREYRLLALFRYWNAIRYFYPNKDLIERDWDTVLPDYIARFEANRDALAYQRTVLQLAAETRDSHSFTRGADVLAEHLGQFVPKVLLREVQGQSVVVRVGDDALPVHPGDIVLGIDGESVTKRIDALRDITAAATPQAASVSIHNNLLRGAQDSTVTLQVRGADGSEREARLPRNLPRTQLRSLLDRSGASFRVLPSGYGYVDLGSLLGGEVAPMFAAIRQTPATIFDMRGYPNGTGWAIAPRLGKRLSPINAWFTRPLLNAIDVGSDLSDSSFSFAQRLPKPEGEIYSGKVVMLINEEAISQAEHTALMFEVATEVTFIGTPTMGANGDVTNLLLPGNLVAHFGGHNVRHADHRPLQRVGVQPTIRVEPSIAGIAAGRDEVLEAAVQFLRASPGAGK